MTAAHVVPFSVLRHVLAIDDARRLDGDGTLSCHVPRLATLIASS